MANIGFNRSQGNKPRVRIETTEANKNDSEKWDIEVIATVVDDNGPISDIEVQFYHNGRIIDSPIATDSDGRATREFCDLDKGSHTFEGLIPGTTSKAKKGVKIKEDKPKRADRLIVTKRFDASGKIELVCEVFTEDGSPVKKAEVLILSTGEQSTTDEKGMAIIVPKIEFGEEEKKRVLEVVVRGTTISRKIFVFKKK
jgi:hypothetical protein